MTLSSVVGSSKSASVNRLWFFVFALEPRPGRSCPRWRGRIANPPREIGDTLIPFVDRVSKAHSELRQFSTDVHLRTPTDGIIPYTGYPNEPETRDRDALEE